MRFDNITPAGKPGRRRREHPLVFDGAGSRLHSLHRDRCGTGGRAVAGFTEQGTDLFRVFGGYLLAEAGHGIQCAPRVAVVEILRADVGQLVADAHEFLGPCAMVDGKAFAEHLAPVQVEQDKAALDVQRADKHLFRAVFGKVALLLIPEFAHDRNTPPVCPVLDFEQSADIGSKSLQEMAETFENEFVIVRHISLSGVCQIREPCLAARRAARSSAAFRWMSGHATTREL